MWRGSDEVDISRLMYKLLQSSYDNMNVCCIYIIRLKGLLTILRAELGMINLGLELTGLDLSVFRWVTKTTLMVEF